MGMPTRDRLDSATSSLFRVREATKGIYHHATEQQMRTERILSDMVTTDPTFNDVVRLHELLTEAAALVRHAHDLSHSLAQQHRA